MASRASIVKAPQPAFVAHCVELLAPLGTVRVKRMFGGWGLYIDEIFMALVAYEQLFLKGDARSAARFEAAGSEPFRFEKDGEMVSTSYWSAPADALDSPALMEPWARMALQTALTVLRARAAKAPRKTALKTLRKPSTKARGSA